MYKHIATIFNLIINLNSEPRRDLAKLLSRDTLVNGDTGASILNCSAKRDYVSL